MEKNMLTIFELEEGIVYNCNFYGDSVCFKRDKNRFLAQVGEGWSDYTTVNTSWLFTEIPGQRNKCPECGCSMRLAQSSYMVGLNPSQFYSGYRCIPCKKTYENPEDPLPKFYSGNKCIK